MDTRALALRTNTARLNAGKHVPPAPPLERFVDYLMKRTMGTITEAEIQAMYAEELDEWADVIALPGVTVNEDGCAIRKDAAEWAETGGIDPHTGDVMPGFIPDTVEELLNTGPEMTGPGGLGLEPKPAFELALFKAECKNHEPDHQCEQAYATAIDDSATIPRERLAAILHAVADAIKDMDNDRG